MIAGTQVTTTLPACVLCGESSRHELTKYDIGIFRCSACDHMFADPNLPSDHVSTVYGDDYFFGGKAGYPNYLEERSLLERRGRNYARKLSRHMQPGTQLDVGAAGGFVLRGFESEGWRGTGLDPNARMVEYGRQHLGLDMVQGTLETFESGRRFDLISLIQVVAHFNDLPRAFSALNSLTCDGGHVLIETWNRDSLTARVFGQYWPEFSPPSVLHWFSPASLSRSLAGYGFHQVASGRMLKWISARHAASLLVHALGVKALDRMAKAVPGALRLPYPSEDLFWMLFRKGEGGHGQ